MFKAPTPPAAAAIVIADTVAPVPNTAVVPANAGAATKPLTGVDVPPVVGTAIIAATATPNVAIHTPPCCFTSSLYFKNFIY